MIKKIKELAELLNNSGLNTVTKIEIIVKSLIFSIIDKIKSEFRTLKAQLPLFITLVIMSLIGIIVIHYTNEPGLITFSSIFVIITLRN